MLIITVFVSAALMFTLQPLVARLLLPVMGGSPAVWNTCMVFFQAVLLAGYAYAHAVGGMKRLRMAVAVHLCVLVLGVAVLPVALPPWGMDPPAGGEWGGQAWWVLLVLAAVAGLPMFAVSATAPLAQKLLAGSRHAAREKPYFLYAASNTGSLIALLSYPVVIEPLVGLRQQGWVWMAGYGMFAALAVGSVVLARRVGFVEGGGAAGAMRPARMAGAGSGAGEGACSTSDVWGERAWWLALSALPSSLLLGVTSYLSTDVAAIPLLWVVPLAVYLGTFVIAFSERARAGVGPRVTTVMLPLVALSVALTMRMGYGLGVVIAQQMLLLLVASLACHVELARRAPRAERLTEFYLVVSLGGVMGGVFNSLVAPVVFDSVLEYPIAVVGACAAAMLAGVGRARARGWVREIGIGVVIGIGAACAAVGLRWGIESQVVLGDRSLRLLAFVPGLVIAFVLCRGRAVWFAMALSGLLVVAWNEPLKGDEGGGRRLFAARTFFGVHRVNEAPSGRFHTLTHGTTVHGLQFVTEELRGLPTMYYHPSGPIGHVFAAMGARGGPRRVAVVGLGAGALAAYAAGESPVEEMDFYEIDAEVVRIARDPKLFTYVTDVERARAAAGRPLKMGFVVGDGRLELARAGERLYDLIVLDAFSSDAIPVHLLTREAMAVYVSRLAEGGVIAVHVSNRHIDLVPVLSAAGREAGLTVWHAEDPVRTEEERLEGKAGSDWVALARGEGDLRALTEVRGVEWRAAARTDARAWTDDWSDVVRRLRVRR